VGNEKKRVQTMLIKKVFFIVIILISSLIFGQKSQRIAYIDMDYILENVPEYVEAQSRLDEKVVLWKGKLNTLRDEIEQMQTELENEKVLLTDEMITEREEDIDIKKKELERLQVAYFGPNGDLYRLRKQFVQPVQDIVFNAIQAIAKRKRYDFVFDKSSDLIMLYYNPDYDISELVLNTIVKNRKRKIIDDRKKSRGNKKTAKDLETEAEPVDAEMTESEESDVETSADPSDPEAVKIEEAKKRQAEKDAKRAALKARIKAQQEAREKLRDSLKRKSERRRQEKLKEIEKRKKEREALLEKTKDDN
jgi:Skp family chaperone for outer membrane proteins